MSDTITELRQYNAWRRGEDVEDGKYPVPAKIGELIDAACDELERLRGIEPAARNIVSVKGRPHSEIETAAEDHEMTRYPNSECEEHRNVKTSEPVCIICMAEEIERLRALAKAHLDARDKEARAMMSFDNAEKNYSNSAPEAREYEKAMLEASAADKALRDWLTHNGVGQQGRAEAPQE